MVFSMFGLRISFNKSKILSAKLLTSKGFNTKYDAPADKASFSSVGLLKFDKTINIGFFEFSSEIDFITPIASSFGINKSIITTSGEYFFIESKTVKPSF